MNNILQTNNYDLFKKVKSNRLVSPTHVKRLATEIKANNMLSVRPILVNKKMEIIDGQHRLEAAKILGYDIFYIVSDTLKEEDISRLNSNNKNWTTMDYINFYHKKGVPEFDVLMKFMNKHSHISTAICIQLLKSGREHTTGKLRDGVLDVSNAENAEKIIKILNDFWNIFPAAYSRTFVIAIIVCMATGKYDHKIMMQRVAKQPRALVKCVNTSQYVQMIEDIYNHGSHDKVRFR